MDLIQRDLFILKDRQEAVEGERTLPLKTVQAWFKTFLLLCDLGQVTEPL